MRTKRDQEAMRVGPSMQLWVACAFVCAFVFVCAYVYCMYGWRAIERLKEKRGEWGGDDWMIENG